MAKHAANPKNRKKRTLATVVIGAGFAVSLGLSTATAAAIPSGEVDPGLNGTLVQTNNKISAQGKYDWPSERRTLDFSPAQVSQAFAMEYGGSDHSKQCAYVYTISCYKGSKLPWHARNHGGA